MTLPEIHFGPYIDNAKSITITGVVAAYPYKMLSKEILDQPAGLATIIGPHICKHGVIENLHLNKDGLCYRCEPEDSKYVTLTQLSFLEESRIFEIRNIRMLYRSAVIINTGEVVWVNDYWTVSIAFENRKYCLLSELSDYCYLAG